MGSEALGEMDLAGNMVRQVEQDMPVEDDGSHVANVGRMVEDMELKMRNLLQEVYFGKAKDVVGDLRSMFYAPPTSSYCSADLDIRHSALERNEQRQSDA